MHATFELEALGFIAAAMFLGAAIGLERHLADKPAGMRTHMLVAGATALLVSLGDGLVQHFAEYDGLVRADPIGLIVATVTGVSFLGAGTIIRGGNQNSVEGLTTAASLLFTAVVGICAATHQLIMAAGATALALLTLRTLRIVEDRARGRSKNDHENRAGPQPPGRD
jgi:putative Mg2+ transporter-C (MgtC) family protein